LGSHLVLSSNAVDSSNRLSDVILSGAKNL